MGCARPARGSNATRPRGRRRAEPFGGNRLGRQWGKDGAVREIRDGGAGGRAPTPPSMVRRITRGRSKAPGTPRNLALSACDCQRRRGPVEVILRPVVGCPARGSLGPAFPPPLLEATRWATALADRGEPTEGRISASAAARPAHARQSPEHQTRSGVPGEGRRLVSVPAQCSRSSMRPGESSARSLRSPPATGSRSVPLQLPSGRARLDPSGPPGSWTRPSSVLRCEQLASRTTAFSIRRDIRPAQRLSAPPAHIAR